MLLPDQLPAITELIVQVPLITEVRVPVLLEVILHRVQVVHAQATVRLQEVVHAQVIVRLQEAVAVAVTGVAAEAPEALAARQEARHLHLQEEEGNFKWRL